MPVDPRSLGSRSPLPAAHSASNGSNGNGSKGSATAEPLKSAATARDAIALGQWLAALNHLLAPVLPARLALVHGMVLADRVQWIRQLPTESGLTIESAGSEPADSEPVDAEPVDDRALRESGGWLVPLDTLAAQPVSLFIAADEPEMDSAATMRSVATLCRAAWRLRGHQLDQAEEESRALGEAIHGLRNGLNSVLMSAAVITTCVDLLPERMQPIAREIEAAAQRSVDRLHTLTALIDPGR